MDPRLAQQDPRFLLPVNRTRAQDEAEYFRLAVVRARNEAVGRGLRSLFGGLWNGIQAILALPRRAAVFDELSALSDRELADIGLNRADIRRVFDSNFVVATTEPVFHDARPQADVAHAPANSNDRVAMPAAA